MDTPPPTPRPVPKPAKKPELTDEYAQSLLHSVNMDFEQKQTAKPKVKHYISKKALIYLVVSTVLGILVTFVASHLLKSKTNSNDTAPQNQQLINSAKNIDNPKAY